MKDRFSWLFHHTGIQLVLLTLGFLFIYSNALVSCPSWAEETWGRGLFIFLVFLLFSILMLWWKAHAFHEDIQRIHDMLTAFSEGRTLALSPLVFQETNELQYRMATVLETAQNVTAKLHHENNELELVFSTMREGVVLLDEDERITRMNRQAAVLFHVSPSKAIGRYWVEVFRSAELAEYLHTKTLEQEQGCDCIRDLEWHHPEHSIFQVQCIPIHNAAGQRTGQLLVFQDVTTLRRLESMRRDFSANVSHELKTPITSILGFIETLRDPETTISNEERNHYLEIVAHQAQRMHAIVEDLLHLSRIETLARDGAIAWETTDVTEIIKSATTMCQHSAQARNIRVEQGFSGPLWLRVHPSLLEQALVNILDNAIKYSGENTTVRIAIENNDDDVRIHIQDQGIGIPEKDLPHIFERFYRVDKGRSRKVGGTGLGLSIAHHILQLHRGRILVKSTLNEGSTFTLVLPKLEAMQTGGTV